MVIRNFPQTLNVLHETINFKVHYNSFPGLFELLGEGVTTMTGMGVKIIKPEPKTVVIHVGVLGKPGSFETGLIGVREQFECDCRDVGFRPGAN